MKDVQVLTDMIISVLMDRRGFDDWYGNLSDSIANDITDEIDETIEDWLTMEETYEMDEE